MLQFHDVGLPQWPTQDNESQLHSNVSEFFVYFSKFSLIQKQDAESRDGFRSFVSTKHTNVQYVSKKLCPVCVAPVEEL